MLSIKNQNNFTYRSALYYFNILWQVSQMSYVKGTGAPCYRWAALCYEHPYTVVYFMVVMTYLNNFIYGEILLII